MSLLTPTPQMIHLQLPQTNPPLSPTMSVLMTSLHLMSLPLRMTLLIEMNLLLSHLMQGLLLRLPTLSHLMQKLLLVPAAPKVNTQES